MCDSHDDHDIAGAIRSVRDAILASVTNEPSVTGVPVGGGPLTEAELRLLAEVEEADRSNLLQSNADRACRLRRIAAGFERSIGFADGRPPSGKAGKPGR
jgi:hypothetical protein